MHFFNPVIPGFNPDPTICRVGNDFYLSTSTFEYFPGLPIYKSQDLVNWELIGNALDRDSQLPLQKVKSSDGLFAPTLRYNKGIFYLTCNNVTGGGNFIVTAKDPAGPWSEPVWMNDFGIDGSLFFDVDGKIYYSRASTDGQNGIMQAELNPKTLMPLAPFKKVWEFPDEWNEAPHLYRINGKYYLIIAAGGTESRHQEVCARADNPMGPFETSPHNPVLTHRDDPDSPISCTGHADIIEAADGSWWAVFLGVRRHRGTSALGRETFLAPVVWKDGWPIIGDKHHAALKMEAPAFAKAQAVKTAQKQFFNMPLPGPEWIHVRNPVKKDYSLSERPGYLRLKGSAAALKDILPQTFMGRRQQHFKMSAKCSMEFSPAPGKEEAGLSLRANDANHFQIALGYREGARVVFFRSTLKSKSEITAYVPFDGKKVFLEISGDENLYGFSWSRDGVIWNRLAEAATADVSPESINGFTGAVIGMYATGNGKPCEAPADFEWFEYIPNGTQTGGGLL